MDVAQALPQGGEEPHLHPRHFPVSADPEGTVVATPGSLDYDTLSTFGASNSTRDGRNDQREIQLALKFDF